MAVASFGHQPQIVSASSARDSPRSSALKLESRFSINCPERHGLNTLSGKELQSRFQENKFSGIKLTNCHVEYIQTISSILSAYSINATAAITKVYRDDE